MLFAEKMNHHTYFGATTLGGNPSALPPMDMTASWKPVGQSSNEFNPIYNDSSSGAGRAGYGSKLITIWRHQDYNNGNQIDQPTIINSAGSSTYAPAAANFPGFHNTGCWNDSQQQTLFHQMPPQYDQMSFQQTEAKFAGNQWGKVEIDQTNPWNLENNAAVIHDQSFHPQQQPQPPSQSYRYNRNNKWDQQAPLRDEGISNSGFSTNIYATTPPYGMVQTFGFGDNRLIPSNGQRGNGGPSQLWAEGSGSTIPAPIVKLGGCEMLNVLPHNNTGPPPHQPHQQHRGQPQMRAGVNGTIFTAGPPPMNIAPPPSSRPLSNHPSHLIPAHMVGPPPAPTPLLSSLNQQSTHSIGNFGGESVSVSMDSLPPNGPNNNMQSEQIDDAYWHWQDPNSWGELPPFGSNVNNNTNSNSNNENNDNNNNSNDASVNSNVPQHFDTQAQPLNNQQQTNQNNSLPERDWSTGTAILPQQHNQQLQSFNKNGIISGGNGQFYGGIPPTSSENPVSTTGQTSFYQQPPSLFSSTVMDPLNTNLDADLQSSGGTGSVEPISRKATVSPSDGNNAFGGGIRQSQQATQCQQNNKVSLVDELSSLTPHGPGGGSYW